MNEQLKLDDLVKSDNENNKAFKKYKEEDGDANFIRASWAGANIPSGWTAEIVGDDVEVTGGKAFSSDDFTTNSDEGTPLVKRKTVNNHDYPETSLQKEFDDRYLVENGDLLVSMDRYFECMLWPYGDAALNQRVCRLSPSRKFNSRYLSYTLRKPLKFLEHLGGTTDFTSLSINEFDNIEIPTPPIVEQRKIASVLYNVDQAIQKTDEIIEQTKHIRKGAIHSLLTNGIDRTEYQETRIGPKKVTVPSEWDVKQISDITDIKNGNRIIPGHEYADTPTDYPFIRISDMEDGTVSTRNIVYLKEETAAQMNRGIISSDDVYITVTGRVGDAGSVPEELDGAHFTDNAAKLYNFDGIMNEYLSLYLRSKFGQDEVHRFTVGSNQPKLSMYRVEKIEVLVPPIDEQKKIVESVSSVDEVIISNKQTKHRLESVKQGLMQDLLSGTVRANDTDIEILEEVAQHG